jgi:hypothetical protein
MNATGPLGFPLTDTQAFNLDAILKNLPKSKEYEYRKTVLHKVADLAPGERSDISWISTDAVDKYNHVVLPKGMNDSQFALNPIVTLNHCYSMPAIGRSVWRKVTKDDDTRGIKAKTVYPLKPDTWGKEPWPPDSVFALIQAGLLNGKSIGWLPTKVHWAEPKEAAKNSWPDSTLVIEEWLLIEYAVGTIPVNPETVVDIVAKANPDAALCKALGWDETLFKLFTPPPFVKHTTMEQLASAITSALSDIDLGKLATDVISRKCGRV